jgi:hypothetical protein
MNIKTKRVNLWNAWDFQRELNSMIGELASGDIQEMEIELIKVREGDSDSSYIINIKT